MTGLALQFTPEGVVLDVNTLVSGNTAQVQNIMVNVGTTKPAPVFAEKGTSLMNYMLRSGFVSVRRSQQLANFAALDSLFFCKTYNTEGDRIENITMEAPDSPEQPFKLSVVFSDETTTEEFSL